ncbi:hypothetical protein SAMN05421676_10635 [Salinibacillus kushneri]|uniref:Uncharacterized protein n=1 Tax=Salinibacillus kushneri TaxID=237682 RepID=A0A1I0FNV2_9BACI|nr:hypothetical protein [Salinibacillus kushneri]SET60098.1 hypothetical protein SAMN05421676_10635 [Salinibacillus kushneri]
MRILRNLKKRFPICLIAIVIYTFSIPYFQDQTVSASEDDHSGGFTIESEKVDGYLELVGALFGKVKIFDAEIHGLTITKVIDNGQNPIMIKIKSEGPVQVKNLETETLDGLPPHLGGLCVPSKAGGLCLKDVTMTVPYQTAENISIPNAKVETCYGTECGTVPEAASMTVEEAEKMLEGIEEDPPSSLEKLNKKLKDNKDQFQHVKDSVKEAETLYDQIKQDDQVQSLKEMIQSVNELVKSDDALGLELTSENLADLKEDIKEEYEAFNQVTSDLFSKVEEASTNLEKLKKDIKTNEEALSKIDEQKTIQDNELQEQAEIYQKLQKKMKDNQQATNEGQKQNQNGQHSSSNENQSSEESASNEEKLDIETLKKEWKTLKKDIKPVEEQLTELKDAVEELKSTKETISGQMDEVIQSLDQFIEQLGLAEEKDSSDAAAPNPSDGQAESGNGDTGNSDTPNDSDESSTEDTSPGESGNENKEDSNQDDKKDNPSSDESNNDNTEDLKQDDETDKGQDDSNKEDSQEDESSGDSGDDNEQEDDDGGLLDDLIDTLFPWRR